MSRHFLWLIISLVLLTSCKTSILNMNTSVTSKQMTIGAIGKKKSFLFQKTFSNEAIPNYKKPVKLGINLKPFNKNTFSNFLAANRFQPAELNITYVDSLPEKPGYIEIHLADKVGVLAALNSKENKGTSSFLSTDKNAEMIIAISMAFNNKELKRLTSAKAVFLVEKSYKTYALELHDPKNNKSFIYFHEGVVFEYEMAHPCWKENIHHQISIVDLVNGSCPKGTFRNSSRAKNPINYLKI